MTVAITDVATGKIETFKDQMVTDRPAWVVVRPIDQNSLDIRVLSKAHFKVETF